MRKILVVASLFAGLTAAGAAQAQIKCWNEGGKRVCGDTPPPGAKTTTIRAPSAPADAPAAASKDALKAPMTAAEREQDYKKRQAAARKDAEKADAARKEQESKQENCQRAREGLAGLESGRVVRMDAKGERYYLDDDQIAKERARANQIVKDSCS